MSRFKKFLIAFDNHGDMIDAESERVFFKFMADWKPDIRIHGGDCFDFRPLRRKADDEERRESLRMDWDMGLDFLERFKPQHFLLGNHCARLYQLAERGGPAADYAYELCRRLEAKAEQMKCRVYPYHKKHGVLQLGHLKVVHGFYAGMYACKQHALVYGSVLHGHTHCFPENTELLTPLGWKKRDGLIIGSEVLSLNLDTGAPEWQKITNVSEGYSEKLLSFPYSKTKFLVTEEHDMVVKGHLNSKRKLSKIKAKDLNQAAISMACAGVDPERPDYPISDNLLKLLGWVVSEGSYEQMPGGYTCLSIAQSDKPKVSHRDCEKILESLQEEFPTLKYSTRLKEKAGSRLNYDAYRIRIRSGALRDEVYRLLPKKQLAPWMLRLSHRQFRILFHELMMTDGCYTNLARSPGSTTSRTGQYCTNREEEADILQALCVLNGMRCIKINRPARGASKPFFVLNTCDRPVKRFQRPSKVPATLTKVWCPTVGGSGTVFARQNGVVIATGNSIDAFSIPGTERRVGRACGALADLDKLEYNSAQPQSLRHANGFPYGILDTQSGHYYIEQAEKIGGQWLLPTEFKAY